MPAHVTARGFGWRHAGRRKPALSGLDLDIPASQKVLLAGASGAGKSTFLHALCGILPAESGEQTGELLLDGQRPDPKLGRCGLVLQDPDSQVILSRVGHDVAFGLENLRFPADQIPGRVRESLDDMGLRLPLDRSTQALSGGQKQRLALAGVLAMRPDVIALDEPTANLDPQSTAPIRDAALRAQEQTSATLIVVEHRLPLWVDHMDRIVVLGPDGVLADGPPDELLAAHADLLTSAGLWLPSVQPPTRAVRPATGPAVLEAAGLTVGRGAKPAARDLSFGLYAGTVTGLTGPNGAGKSTTALTMGGLLAPLSGTVRAQRDLVTAAGPTARHDSPHRWPSRALSARIGTVFQEPEHQFLTGTVRDELAFGPQKAGMTPEQVADRTYELLERLRLTALAAAHPQTLSGGEKRRLSVACMLAARPAVLNVDEPTFGQDAQTWAALAQLFNEAADAGAAVLAVSHDEDFLAAVGATRLDFTADHDGSTVAWQEAS